MAKVVQSKIDVVAVEAKLGSIKRKSAHDAITSLDNLRNARKHGVDGIRLLVQRKQNPIRCLTIVRRERDSMVQTAQSCLD